VNVYASSGLTNTIDKSFFVKKEGERITLWVLLLIDLKVITL
jgi:hypothetical protein